MLLECISRSFPKKRYDLDASYMRLVPKRVADESGLLKQTFVYERFDIAQENAMFKSSDFSLDNLIAIGASATLTPIVMFGGSNVSVVDSMQGYSNLNVASDETKA